MRQRTDLPAVLDIEVTTHGRLRGAFGLLGVPFPFFVDAARSRGSVVYHRYDGHYGLITPVS
jgi:hypothetical protein